MEFEYGQKVHVEWNNGLNKWRLRNPDNKKEHVDVDELDISNGVFTFWEDGDRKRGTIIGTYMPFSAQKGRPFYFRSKQFRFEYMDNHEPVEELPALISLSVAAGNFLAIIPTSYEH